MKYTFKSLDYLFQNKLIRHYGKSFTNLCPQEVLWLWFKSQLCSDQDSSVLVSDLMKSCQRTAINVVQVTFVILPC